VLRRFGYTDEEWRIDQTQHPFMTSPGHGDIRLTTNFRPDDLSSLFATMHEFGHGVYEWGVDESIAGTPLGSGVSRGVHESQSRTWTTSSGAAVRSGVSHTRACRRHSPVSSARSTR